MEEAITGDFAGTDPGDTGITWVIAVTAGIIPMARNGAIMSSTGMKKVRTRSMNISNVKAGILQGKSNP